VPGDELEKSLLKGLAEAVLRVEVIDYAVARMKEALRKGHEKLNAALERMRQRKQQLEVKLARLVNAIAEGQSSKSIMEAISERERELQAITNRLLEPGPGSLQATLDELRYFAISRLAKIRELVTHPEPSDLLLKEIFDPVEDQVVPENGGKPDVGQWFSAWASPRLPLLPSLN